MIFFAQVLKEQGRYKTCWDGTELKCLPVIYPRVFLLPPPPDMKVIKPQSCESLRKKWATFLHHETWRKTGKLPLEEVFMLGWKDRGKAACDNNSCSTWQSKTPLKVTLFCLLQTAQPLQMGEKHLDHVPRKLTDQCMAGRTDTILLHEGRCWWSKQCFKTL